MIDYDHLQSNDRDNQNAEREREEKLKEEIKD